MSKMNPTSALHVTRNGALCALAALGSVAGLTACGSSSDSAAPSATVANLADADGASSSTDSAADQSSESTEPLTDEQIERAQLEYNQCLAAEGVELGFSAGDQGESVATESQSDTESQIDAEAYEATKAAYEKCDAILQKAFGSYEPSPEEQAAYADQDAKFKNCLTEFGIEVQNDDGDGPLIPDLGAGQDYEKYEEASETCADRVWGDESLSVVGSES